MKRIAALLCFWAVLAFAPVLPMTFVVRCPFNLTFPPLPAWGAELRGTVKDVNGEPLHGASVFLDGTSKGTATAASGEYVIRDVPPGDYLLVATLIGYTSARREITVAEELATLEYPFVVAQVALDLGEVVVVTANKHRENLQVVPSAISAISMEQLNDLTVRDRTDLNALAPNSFIAESGSHTTDLINIRGMFPSTPFGATSLFYYDGVPIYGYGLNPMYLNDIERVEIIRGPQAILYGRNALAGVVSLISQKPNNNTRVTVGLDYGNYNQSKLSFGISVPLRKDGLFLRTSGYVVDRDGYYTNTTLHRNSGASHGWGGTATLRYFLTKPFSAELFTNLEKIDEEIWPFAADPEAALAHPYDFQADVDSRIKKLNAIGSIKLDYQFPKVEIVSTTAYQDVSHSDWRNDADFSPLDVISFISTTPSRIWSQELRSQSVASAARTKWIGGLFYSSETKDSDYSAILGKVWAESRHVPIYPIYQTTTGDEKVEGMAAFGQLTYSIFRNHVDVTGGVRLERQKIKENTTTRYFYNGDPMSTPPFDAIALNKLRQQWDFVSPRFSVSYRFTDASTAYASASRGFNGGGANSAANRIVPFYDPEYTWNYEIGYKTSLLENRLRLNADAFWIDWRKQQLLTVGDLSSPFQTITNAGKTVNKGIELEVTALPTRGLTLGGSIGVLDAEFRSFRFTETRQEEVVVYDYAGNELPFAPPFSSRLTMKYEHPVRLAGSSVNWVVIGEHQYFAPYYMSHLNWNRSTARNLVGGRIGVTTHGVDAFLWVKNLLDYRYVYCAYEYRGGQQAYLGAPRTVGLSVAYRH